MRAALAFLASAASGAVSAQAPFERVQQPVLRGYEQIVLQDRPDGHIEQWVPIGQTLLRWTRMVTIQRFDGLARRTDPAAYLAAIQRSVRASCQGALVTPVTEWALSTYPTAQIRAYCPRNPATNRPESFLMQAMGGYSDLYVVQFAFRTNQWQGAFAFAQRHMDGVRLCGPASEEEACRPPQPVSGTAPRAN